MTLPRLIRNAPPKPAKGSALLARRQARATVKAHEDQEKAKVRKRDRGCRWPGCGCRKLKIRTEVAHLDAKGMGGDHGVRTTADRMMELDVLVHQGAVSLHSGDRRVTPLTKAGTNGPCRFEEKRGALWVLIGIERAVGVLVLTRRSSRKRGP